MAKLYTKEERIEDLKLAEEVGTAAAVQRLGIKEGTIYGWRARDKTSPRSILVGRKLSR
ncbi:MAG: hypothetical protein PHD36_06305 [Desulfotomaculaceae bacterium]|nr:hypothetical protein [Desulfotomaculaceae bacterium]